MSQHAIAKPEARDAVRSESEASRMKWQPGAAVRVRVSNRGDGSPVYRWGTVVESQAGPFCEIVTVDLAGELKRVDAARVSKGGR